MVRTTTAYHLFPEELGWVAKQTLQVNAVNTAVVVTCQVRALPNRSLKGAVIFPGEVKECEPFLSFSIFEVCTLPTEKYNISMKSQSKTPSIEAIEDWNKALDLAVEIAHFYCLFSSLVLGKDPSYSRFSNNELKFNFVHSSLIMRLLIIGKFLKCLAPQT